MQCAPSSYLMLLWPVSGTCRYTVLVFEPFKIRIHILFLQLTMSLEFYEWSNIFILPNFGMSLIRIPLLEMKSDLDLHVSDQLFFSVREAISTIMKETCGSVVDTPRRELTRRCGIALVWFLASVLLAVEIPDIGKILAFLFRFCVFHPFWTGSRSDPPYGTYEMDRLRMLPWRMNR